MRLPSFSYYLTTTYGTIESTERDSGPVFHGLQLSYRQSELDIQRRCEVGQKEEIVDCIDKGLQTVLTINDGQVLSTSVPNRGEDEDVLSEAYPNLDTQHFYYQIWKTSEQSFIAVCRKSYVDTLLQEFSDLGISITSVFLGNLCTGVLPAYTPQNPVQTSTDTILYKSSEITAITPNSPKDEVSYAIGSLSVSSKSITGLSALLYTLTPEKQISGNTTKLDTELRKEYREKQHFKKILSAGLGSLLFFLLLNFLVFSSVYSSWQTLQEEVRTYTVQNQKISEQQQRVAQKEKMVTSILTTGFSKSSFYTDQLLSRLPESIQLDSYGYQPLERKIQKDKSIRLRSDYIQIKGKSKQKQDFTNWVQSVESLDFVEKTTILSYGRRSSEIPGFELQIQLRHDSEN